MSRSILSGIVLLALAGGTALAAEGRTPIWEPTTITESGVYFLTRDIYSEDGTGPSIVVQSGLESVEIDLNGFSVVGDPDLTDRAIIEAIDVNRVVVRHGLVVSRSDGLEAAIYIGNARRGAVEGVTSFNSGGPGIVLEFVDTASVRNNSVQNATGLGILVAGRSQGVTAAGEIVGNVVWNSNEGIVVENASGVVIRDNRVSGSLERGISISECEACLVVDNSVRASFGGNGIELHPPSDGCEIRWNTVVGSSEVGILVEADSALIVDNVARDNGTDGLSVRGNESHIERNVLMSNGRLSPGWGLHLRSGSSRNYYGRNTAAGNAGSSCTTNDFCDSGTGNVSFGDNRMPAPL